MGTGSENLRSVRGPYAFVGDLHGRVGLLDLILSRDPKRKYHYVFMGDVIHHKPFFKHNKRTSPIRMLRAISDLIGEGRATLLLGNNENYILRSLILPEQEIKKKEVKYTLKCLKEVSLDERLKFVNMMSNAPLSLELEGKFRLAHAYYPHPGTNVSRDTCLHGPGYVWFRDDNVSDRHNLDPAYTYFFGHYGLPYYRENIRIVDATSLEAAGVYYSDRDEFMVYY